jgi:hypothetical protein
MFSLAFSSLAIVREPLHTQFVKHSRSDFSLSDERSMM